jgi:zinc and cadmium transporter
MMRLTHRGMQLILSLVSGVMLGVALLHMLPHSIQTLRNPGLAFSVCLFGLLFMFFMVRTFHFHHHDLAMDLDHEHKKKELCDEKRHHVHCEHHGGAIDFSWIGLCFGLTVHTLIDGIALATAVYSQPQNGWVPSGLVVFLAIVLHKPLDALSITSLMATKGWSSAKQMAVNVVFSLVCPLGAMLFALSVDSLVDWRDWLLGVSLAFSAGVFLCISLGDLLPEVHFHSHDRLQLSAMLIIGVVLAWLLESLPGHRHDWILIDQKDPKYQELQDREADAD